MFGFELSVLDPEGRVLCCAFGFHLSVPDPEGRVLCCVLAGSEGDPSRGLMLVVETAYRGS